MAQVITFYSYKGGTGRSLALANVAWVLASNDRRVLAIDWDLEAPGLHYYFRPFLPDPDLTGYGVQGVIDIVREYAAQAVTPRPSDPSRDVWFRPLANIRRHAIPLTWPNGERIQFGERGGIDLIPAGRQEGQLYADRVNSFDWKRLYAELNGGAFFDAVKKELQPYDYVLIDSRTGVSDTAGICTIQMPDALVVCFTLNNQSISGAATVASSVAQRRPEMPVFPVPMRVDPFERDKANARREYTQKVFRERVEALRGKLPWPIFENYWNEVELPYYAAYAYEELLSPFERFSKSTGSILPNIEKLARVLTSGFVEELKRAPEDPRKSEVASLYQDVPALTPLPEPVPDTASHRSRLRLTWAIYGLWVIFTGLIAWRTLAVLNSKESSEQLLATLLVSYAKAHEADVEEAASALAAAGGLPVSEEARTIALRLIQKGIPYATISGQFYGAALSPDGRLVAATAPGANLRLSDSGSRRVMWSAGPVDPKARLQFSPDGTKLAVMEKETDVWDALAGPPSPLWTVKYVPNTFTALTSGFSPDGSRWALLVKRDQRIYVLEYRIAPKPVTQVSEFPDAKFPLNVQPMDKALSPDGSLVAITDGTTVSVWTLPAEQKAVDSRTLPQAPPVIKYAFGDSMTKMLLAAADSARVWDLPSGTFRGQIHLPQPPEMVALQRNGDAAAIVLSDGTIHLYEGPDLKRERTLGGAKPPIRDLKFTQDGKLVYVLYGPTPDAANTVIQDSGIYAWRVGLPGLSADPGWNEISAFLKAARGPCLSARGRQEIYGEKPDVAEQRFDQCRNANGASR